MERSAVGGLSANPASSEDLLFLFGCTRTFADACEVIESPSLLGVPELGGSVILFAVDCSIVAPSDICLYGGEPGSCLPMFSFTSPAEAAGSAGG